MQIFLKKLSSMYVEYSYLYMSFPGSVSSSLTLSMHNILSSRKMYHFFFFVFENMEEN